MIDPFEVPEMKEVQLRFLGEREAKMGGRSGCPVM